MNIEIENVEIENDSNSQILQTPKYCTIDAKRFPEIADTQPPRGSYVPLKASIFLDLDKYRSLERQTLRGASPKNRNLR